MGIKSVLDILYINMLINLIFQNENCCIIIELKIGEVLSTLPKRQKIFS